MNATEKSSRKGFAILTVGVLIGIGVGIAACVTAIGHSPAASNTAIASQVTESAPPPLTPAPAQAAPSTIYYAAAQPQIQETYQQQPQLAPPMVTQYTQDGSLALPVATITTVEYSTPQVITAGNINPNWTVGKNGLLQNPCVDPPSAHGRATGQY